MPREYAILKQRKRFGLESLATLKQAAIRLCKVGSRRNVLSMRSLAAVMFVKAVIHR